MELKIYQKQTLAKLAAFLAEAKVIGQRAAEAAKAANISLVVVDRGGFKYTGRIAAIVESAVEAGLSISAKKEDK